jgi:hypothetical protein
LELYLHKTLSIGHLILTEMPHIVEKSNTSETIRSETLINQSECYMMKYVSRSWENSALG